MNKIHRLIWSHARNAWIVAPETAKSHGKAGSKAKTVAVALASALIAQTAYAQPVPAPNALPTGGQVIAGQAAIAQSGNAMTVQQATNQAILNWNSFNIGSQASVNFQQPNASAVALNRVVGSDPSAIYGRLTANGQVFLVNPNGVLFGQGAKIDVGGLVASTLNIRNQDFLAGNYRFTRDGATAGVTNQGELLGKYVALLAPEVRNEGVIAAAMGTAALAAGEAVTLGLTGNNLIDVQVEQGRINTLVENKQLVKADQGTVILSAQSAHTLLGQVVNSGAIEAGGIETSGGTIRLLASSDIQHSGSITADAGTNGNGGSVILMGDLANPNSQTQVSGSITARGGSASGDGGFVETSGAHLNIADSAKIDTSAANGKSGTWLLDPVQITVANTGGTVSVGTLQAALAAGNVILDTTNSSSCVGVDCSTAPATGDSITLADNITWSSANFLQLWSEGTINVNAVVHNTNTTGGGIEFTTFMGNVAFGANGLVKISNAEQLQLINTATDNTTFKLVGNYELANNIDASLGVMSTNIVWAPIGFTGFEFAGTLDGKGYTVSNIRMDASQTNEAGLFGVIDTTGVVRNVGIVDPVDPLDVNTHRIGALAGINHGLVENSYVRSATTTLSGNGNVVSAGGLVGENTGTIRNSYANIAVDTGVGSTATQGGLVGNNSGTVQNSYSIGAVSANAVSNGGLVGNNTNTITNSFYNSQTSGRNDANGTPKTTVQMTAATVVSDLGLDVALWTLDATTGYPVLVYNAAGVPTLIYVRLITGSSIYGEAVNLNYGLFSAATGGTSISDANPSVATSLTWTGTVPTNTSNVGGYSLTYSSGITLGNTAYSLAAGDAAIWTINSRPVTITPTSGQSKVYGEVDPTYTYAVQSGTQGSGSGLLSGDNLALSGALNRAAGENVANGPYAFTLGNLAAANNNYSIALSGSAPTFAITPRTVTLSASKTYDGTTTLSGTQVVIGNLVPSQTLSYTGATASDAHVATTNKYISGITLTDGTGLASNYQLPALVSAIAGVNTVTISAKTLTPTLSNTGVTKVYDGNTDAPAGFAPTYTFNGLVGGDTAATLTHTAAGYNSKDVVTANKITVSGLTISGITGGNNSAITDYVLDATSKDVAATITQKGITVSAPAMSKVYDGNNTATVNLANLTISGYAPGESGLYPLGGSDSNGNLSGTYSDKNASRTLTVTLPLTGWGNFFGNSDPANYNLPASVTIAGEITKRTITGQLVGTISKVYDGTANATIALNNVQYDTTGYVSGEMAYISGTGWQSGTYVDAADQANGHAGTGKKVIVNIDPATYTAWDCVAVPFTGCTATNVNNYSFPTTLTGNVGVITPATLTPTLSNTSVTKVYDGTTNAPAAFTPTYTFSGLVGGDTAATLTYTAAGYNSKDVVTANKITVSGLTISGITGGNNSAITDYVLDATSKDVVASITPQDITVSFTPTTLSKVYDGNTSATVKLSDLSGFNFNGFVGNEYLLPGSMDMTAGTIPGTYSGKDAATGLTITVPMSGWTLPAGLGGSSIIAGDPANYNLPANFTVAGEITKRPITGQLVGTVSKIYDGTANATIALNNVQYDMTGYVFGEAAYINGTSWQSGTFVDANDAADKNVGTGKKIIVNINPAEYAPWPGTTTNLNNYSFPSVLSGNVGVITPKALTVSGLSVAASKPYDGTPSATAIGTPTLQGAIAAGTGTGTDGKPYQGDTVNFTGTLEALYNSKDVVTANTVSFSGLASDNANYTLTMPTDAAATITARPLTVTPDNKTIYQNDPLPAFTYTVQGGIGESLTGSPDTNATSTASVGSFAITQGTLSYTGNPNYLINWAGNGTLTILITPEDAVVSPTDIASIGSISGGRGTVNVGTTGNTTTLTQQGNHLLLDWSSFAIPTGKTLEFAQPGATSVAVNRINTGSASNIYGSLHANGIVFLINPSGIVFKPGAQIDVQGLVAAALGVQGFQSYVTPADIVWSDIDSTVFNASRLSFNGTGATLRNEANLSLGTGKFWGFYGNTVENAGTISAAGGSGTHADSWKDANTLTLSSQGNIALDSALTMNGNSRLILETGQGSANGGSSDYSFKAAPTLGAGSAFATRQGSSGVLTNYAVLTDLAGLRTMSGNIAIGSNIDGSATQSGTAFTAQNITGTVAGLGHTISNLKGNGFIENINGTVRDLGMVNVNFSKSSALLGGLANIAIDGSNIRNSYVTGSVVSGNNMVGGLIGRAWNGTTSLGNMFNYDTTTITNCYSTAAVSGKEHVGGLVGHSMVMNITNSYATGSVAGTKFVGGLIGSYMASSFTNTFATGDVSGTNFVGGLVGEHWGGLRRATPAIPEIINSYASGNVTGTTAGALMGGFDSDYGDTGNLFGNSYGSGMVNGKANGALFGSDNNSGALGGGKRLTVRESVAQSSYADWDFTNTWEIEAGKSTPWLKGLPRPTSVSVTIPPVEWDAGKLFVSLFNTSENTSLKMVSRHLDTVSDETKYLQKEDLKEIKTTSAGFFGMSNVDLAKYRIGAAVEQMAKGETLTAENIAEVNKDFNAVLKTGCPSCKPWTDTEMGFWLYLSAQVVNQPERLQAAAEAKAKAAEEKAAAEKAAAEKAAAEKAAAEKAAAEKAAAEKAAAEKVAAAKKAADDLRSKENALENAKREAAFWTKESQKAADDAAAARATADKAKTSVANFEAEKVKWEKMSVEKEAQIPLTAKAAADDAAAAKTAYAKWQASDATLKKMAPEVDAAGSAKLAAERELEIAQKELDSLGFSLSGSDAITIGMSIGNEISKASRKEAAEARVAKAQEAYDQAAQNEVDKLNAYNKLVAQSNEESNASNAAASKATESDRLARLTKAEKEMADKNVVIFADNAKNAEVYAKETEQYAAQMEDKAKRAATELPVYNDRVKKAEEALAAAKKK